VLQKNFLCWVCNYNTLSTNRHFPNFNCWLHGNENVLFHNRWHHCLPLRFHSLFRVRSSKFESVYKYARIFFARDVACGCVCATPPPPPNFLPNSKKRSHAVSDVTGSWVIHKLVELLCRTGIWLCKASVIVNLNSFLVNSGNRLGGLHHHGHMVVDQI
jgi:hypothetical protein